LSLLIEKQTHSILGRLGIEGPCGVFAMSGLRAERYAAPRLALIAETAHFFPPIGAQGLNLSLRDIANLVEAVEQARQDGADVGDAAVLDRYDASRRRDIAGRVNGVDILNRSLLTSLLPVDFLRGAGLLALANIAPLRRRLMREGVMPHGHVPKLMASPAFSALIPRMDSCER
jgi:2-octaprenyl-6-methoxyphenol hydroxylase